MFDRSYGTDNIIFRNCTIDNTAHRNLLSASNLTIGDCLFRRPRVVPRTHPVFSTC